MPVIHRMDLELHVPARLESHETVPEGTPPRERSDELVRTPDSDRTVGETPHLVEARLPLRRVALVGNKRENLSHRPRDLDTGRHVDHRTSLARGAKCAAFSNGARPNALPAVPLIGMTVHIEPPPAGVPGAVLRLANKSPAAVPRTAAGPSLSPYLWTLGPGADNAESCPRNG